MISPPSSPFVLKRPSLLKVKEPDLITIDPPRPPLELPLIAPAKLNMDAKILMTGVCPLKGLLTPMTLPEPETWP